MAWRRRGSAVEAGEYRLAHRQASRLNMARRGASAAARLAAAQDERDNQRHGVGGSIMAAARQTMRVAARTGAAA